MNKSILLLLVTLSLATRPEAPKPDQSSPKSALKYFDALGTDEKTDRAGIIYHATTPDEKKVAEAFASVDLALAKLRGAAAAKFDRAAGDAMVHALRDVTADDVEAAKETVTDDKATLTGKNVGEPLPMVKVDGRWKISLTDAIAQSQATADDLVASCGMLVEAMDATRKEIAAGKYANPSLLERAVKRRVRSVLGGE